MASTAYQVPFHVPQGADGKVVDESLRSRYHTEPSYSSSSILKSFRHELNFFGHKRVSVSAPTSPRRASSPDIEIPTALFRQAQQQLDRNSSDPRKLSLVKEETEREVSGTSGGLVVAAKQGSESLESKPAIKPPEEKLSSVPKDMVDAELPRKSHKSLTTQVMTWFVTPQKPAAPKTNRTEFNAVTPSSF